MKIEKQVTPLKQSGILDSLGIKMQNGQYFWVAFGTQSGQEFVLCRPASHIEEHSREWAWFMIGEHSDEITSEIEDGSISADGAIYNAYTVAELGVLLPKQGYNSRQSQPSGTWVCEDGFEDELKEGDTEAEARANMLIHLLECGLSAETCNSRLAE